MNFSIKGCNKYAIKHAIRNGVIATLNTKIIGAHSGLILKRRADKEKQVTIILNDISK